MYRSNKSQGLVLLGVHSDKNAASGLKIAKQKKITYPVVQDIGNKTNDAYKIQGYPTVIVVDKKGIVRFVYPKDLDKVVKQLLKEK